MGCTVHDMSITQQQLCEASEEDGLWNPPGDVTVPHRGVTSLIELRRWASSELVPYATVPYFA